MSVLEKLFALESKAVQTAGEVIDAAIVAESEGLEGPSASKLMAALDAAGWTVDEFRQCVVSRKNRLGWAAVLATAEEVRQQRANAEADLRKAEAALQAAREKLGRTASEVNRRLVEISARESEIQVARQQLRKTARPGLDHELRELAEQSAQVREQIERVREQLKLVPRNRQILEANISKRNEIPENRREGSPGWEYNQKDRQSLVKLRRRESELAQELASLESQLADIAASQDRLELEKLQP